MMQEDKWNEFISDLQAYIQIHHHLPDKHRVENRRLLNQVKYFRKKMKEGTMDPERAKLLTEVLATRSNEHTGGRKKKTPSAPDHSANAAPEQPLSLFPVETLD